MKRPASSDYSIFISQRIIMQYMGTFRNNLFSYLLYIYSTVRTTGMLLHIVYNPPPPLLYR